MSSVHPRPRESQSSSRGKKRRAPPSSAIRVGQLPLNLTENELREFFNLSENIVSIEFEAYANVHFDSAVDAQRALELDQNELLGYPITVTPYDREELNAFVENEDQESVERDEGGLEDEEFLMLLDDLVVMHKYAKSYKKGVEDLYKQCKEGQKEVEEGQRKLLGLYVHKQNSLYIIREKVGQLIRELESSDVFYASNKEHLKILKKFMSRKEVRLVTDDDICREELILEAEKMCLRVAKWRR